MLTVYEVEKKEWLLQIPDRAKDIILAPLHHYTVKTTFLDFYLLCILPLQKQFNLAFYNLRV